MSSSERDAGTIGRWRLFAGLALVALALPACTVRPLYSSAPIASTGVSVMEDLSSIAIKPVTTRQALEVRNHLIFLLSGGKGEPADPRYTITLTVASVQESAAAVQVVTENEPTAAAITMIGTYRMVDTTGKVVASGTRRVQSSYDVPRQEFAAARAQRDAENRAARELAELLKLVIAQELSKA